MQTAHWKIEYGRISRKGYQGIDANPKERKGVAEMLVNKDPRLMGILAGFELVRFNVKDKRFVAANNST